MRYKNVEHKMGTIQNDCQGQLSATTTQKEYRYKYEDPVQKERTDGIIDLAPMLNDAPWQPPDEFAVRGAHAESTRTDWIRMTTRYVKEQKWSWHACGKDNSTNAKRSTIACC